MTVATTTYRFRYNLLRHLPGLGLLLAAVAMVLLALGPIGWRAGWWHFRVGFFYLMPWAGYFGIAAVLVSVLPLVLERAVIGRKGVAIGIVACIAGGVAAYTPIHYYAMRGRYPPIDDITTDTANPPAFIAAVAARLAEGDIRSRTGASESLNNNGAPTPISRPWPSQYRRRKPFRMHSTPPSTWDGQSSMGIRSQAELRRTTGAGGLASPTTS